jgi:hypothetical protein
MRFKIRIKPMTILIKATKIKDLGLFFFPDKSSDKKILKFRNPFNIASKPTIIINSKELVE